MSMERDWVWPKRGLRNSHQEAEVTSKWVNQTQRTVGRCQNKLGNSWFSPRSMEVFWCYPPAHLPQPSLGSQGSTTLTLLGSPSISSSLTPQQTPWGQGLCMAQQSIPHAYMSAKHSLGVQEMFVAWMSGRVDRKTSMSISKSWYPTLHSSMKALKESDVFTVWWAFQTIPHEEMHVNNPRANCTTSQEPSHPWPGVQSRAQLNKEKKCPLKMLKSHLE